jgi:hypothetical protein
MKNRIMILTSATAGTDLKKIYHLEFESKRCCENLNFIKYYVITKEIKHDIRQNLTLEQLMNLYE